MKFLNLNLEKEDPQVFLTDLLKSESNQINSMSTAIC